MRPKYGLRVLAQRALDTASARGATYADIRLLDRVSQSIQTRNGQVDNLLNAKDQGFGIRVIVDGAWGFASSHDPDPKEVDRVAGLAVEIARASASVRAGVARLAEEPAVTDRYETPVV
ncbi:MAG: TldD/PmbA family protein, partial [Chloroflexota bacterium]|nr:TldD/PmbA family protein [Chloroflexota bacterium]